MTIAFLLAQSISPAAQADPATIIQGASKTIGSVIQLPKAILQHAVSDPFPFGVVSGAVAGTYQTVADVLSGTVQMAVGAAPYAKYLIFFI